MNQSDLCALHEWPGKSASESRSEHPAVRHMLDVGAVAEVLAEIEGFSSRRKSTFALFAALHDLGKIGSQFRAMIRNRTPQSYRHWEVSEAHLIAAEGTVMAALGVPSNLEPVETTRQIFATSAGHHGRPPSRPPSTGSLAGGSNLRHLRTMRNLAGTRACTDSDRIVDAFVELWPEATLEGVAPVDIRRMTWSLAGLITVADWIGSNSDWFPPQPGASDLGLYLEGARDRARRAVAASGLLSAKPRSDESRVFDFDYRPLQKAAESITLRDGPMLAVLEDETGAGKTEAALILADRMMRAGKGRGLFFALPTMATANAMFGRMSAVIARLFSSPPSLTLAHGRAGANNQYRSLVGARDSEPDDTDDPGCTRWLADDRRRALLADVGIGTIDQALLGVLPTRHSAVRLWGLSKKILIVDEAHEYDPYMAREIEGLLFAHARQGGSAILMTATLPISMRDRFSRAFETGANRATSNTDGRDRSYPALRVVGGETIAAPPTVSLRPPIRIHRCASEGDAIELVANAVECGAAIAWVRNAVDDACRAAAILTERHIPCDLLHARFALCDRLDHEERVLATFGRERDKHPGRALVGTQVLESSLDLDFDLMVTDIAPMASVIQRAGRLWRHMDYRPAEERPFPEPPLYVVSPDPNNVECESWLNDTLDAGAWVYPQSLAWRTARVLFDRDRIAAPDDLRGLVEAVHGEDVPPLPPAFERDAAQVEGAAMAQRGHARQNIIQFDDGYPAMGENWDDADYPTRLGRPQTTLLLMREEESGALIPWAGGTSSDPRSLMLSEVMADKRKIDRLALPDSGDARIRDVIADWPEWRRSILCICPVGTDGSICPGLRYDRRSGLSLEVDGNREGPQ